jgi:hypothetical protein
MLGYLVVLVVGVLAGGFGGYKYGRTVEAKAQAILSALKQ